MTPKLNEPDKSEVHRQMADYARESILREYAKAGVEPVYFAGSLVSPSLLKSLGQWPEKV